MLIFTMSIPSYLLATVHSYGPVVVHVCMHAYICVCANTCSIILYAHVLIMHSTCGMYQMKHSVQYATYGLDNIY